MHPSPIPGRRLAPPLPPGRPAPGLRRDLSDSFLDSKPELPKFIQEGSRGHPRRAGGLCEFPLPPRPLVPTSPSRDVPVQNRKKLFQLIV